MPNRKDIWGGLRQMLLDSGVKTVVRGFAEPTGDWPFQPGDCPVACCYEPEDERVDEHATQGAYALSGSFMVDMYDSPDNPAGVKSETQDNGWGAIDALHDNMLRLMQTQFPKYFSNTTTLSCDRFQMFWYLVKGTYVGGGMRVKWQMNFA